MLRIRPFLSDDLEKIISLADDQLGKGYVISTDFLSPNRIVFVAEDKRGHLLGFIMGYIENLTGIIKTLAIERSVQKKGLGKSLIEKMLAVFASEKMHKVVVVAWMHCKSQKVPLESLMKMLEFKEEERISNFWKNDSLLRHYNCPVCGAPPCLCTAVIFSSSSFYL